MSSILGYETAINDMIVYNGDLYVCGTFDTAGGVPVSCIAKWDGISWSSVGSGIKLQRENQQPFVMCVYNNALYVGGTFDSVGGVAATNIAKWDGSSWSAVGAGLGIAGTSVYSDTNGVYCLTVYSNKLIAGGYFNVASSLPVNNIAAWNGSTWSILGSGVSGGVQAMSPYQNDLYASMSYSDGAGHSTYFVSKWNGSSWTNIVAGPGTGTNYYGFLIKLMPFNGELLGAGDFGIINNNDTFTTGIATWNGSTWSQFLGLQYHRTQLSQSGDGIEEMINYNNHLYIGGAFAQAGATQAANIAEYTCGTNGISEIAKVNTSIYPNPNTGIFTILVDNIEPLSDLNVFDLKGRQIYKSVLKSNESEIKLDNAIPGTYLYRISNNNNSMIASGSFIVE